MCIFGFGFGFASRFHASGVPPLFPDFGKGGCFDVRFYGFIFSGCPILRGLCEGWAMRPSAMMSFATASRDFQDSDKVFGRS